MIYVNLQEEEESNPYMNLLAEDSIILHGLEDCIQGVDHRQNPIYDYMLMLNKFMQDGMTECEAMEWIEYNIEPINGGQGFVIHYY